MVNKGTRTEQLREALARTREALARNTGTPTEQDWRDAVERAERRYHDAAMAELAPRLNAHPSPLARLLDGRGV